MKTKWRGWIIVVFYFGSSAVSELLLWSNPFNPLTTISYDLIEEYVELAVYSMRGEKVTTLMKGKQESGSYRMNWDGTDRNGDILASGIYFLRIASGSYSRTNKMIFLR